MSDDVVVEPQEAGQLPANIHHRHGAGVPCLACEIAALRKVISDTQRASASALTETRLEIAARADTEQSLVNELAKTCEDRDAARGMIRALVEVLGQAEYVFARIGDGTTKHSAAATWGYGTVHVALASAGAAMAEWDKPTPKPDSAP